MAGRPKSEQTDEKRIHRTAVRWTESERDLLEDVRKKLDLRYEVDVIRLLTLGSAMDLLAEKPQTVAE